MGSLCTATAPLGGFPSSPEFKLKEMKDLLFWKTFDEVLPSKTQALDLPLFRSLGSLFDVFFSFHDRWGKLACSIASSYIKVIKILDR